MLDLPSYLIWVLNIAFQTYTWLIVARALLSFMRLRADNPVLRFVYEVTEPVLALFRRLLPQTGSMDFSPLLGLLFLQIANQLVVQLLSFLFYGRY
ncbi:MAG: YggT family protein [Thermacetogeniaceae bacterium]